MKFTLTFLIVVLVPVIGLGFSSGPPDDKTGAPGQGTCIDCHSSFPLNSGDGSFTIDAPATYSQGETYTITITLADAGQSRWGFEFSPLDQGSLTITDATNTQQSSSGSNLFAKQTSTGTFSGTDDGPVNWSFDWTAPASSTDPVIVYATGNAANANGSTAGDYIYSAVDTINFATGIYDDDNPALPGTFALTSYPNPFNANVNITFDLTRDDNVRLEVYDIAGRLINELSDNRFSAGNHIITWNGRDTNGNSIASGMYLIKMVTSEGTAADKIVMLK